jgi:hypothetical protein
MDRESGKRIAALGQRVVEKFDQGNWEEVGLLTGYSNEIRDHPRLLRSLSFGDDDYSANVFRFLKRIADEDARAFQEFEGYVDRRFGDLSEYVSSKPAVRRITFAPNVFAVPDASLDVHLAAVMMPLAAEFDRVYKAIDRACAQVGLHCLRAADIWEDSVIVQDIFNLVFRAHIIIVDFSGKNPNVMYETGIAHTLGKHVVPITQSIDDVPFDLKHHRVLRYLANTEGLRSLTENLSGRLHRIMLSAESAEEESTA